MVYLSNITTSQQVYIPRQVVNTGSSQNGGCIDLNDYYTREEVDALISGITPDVTKEYVDDQDAATLQSAEAYTDQEIAAETARTESTYAKPSDIPSLDGYATEQWVEEQGYVTENDLGDYAKSSAVTQEIATAIASETARTESTYLKAGALDDYYTKTEADSKFASESAITAETTRATEAESGLSQAISAETSARESAITQIETALSGKADSATTLSGYGITDAYTKSEVDTALAGKADTATTYTKTEVDNALAGKADTATTYTKTEVDNAITAATSGKQDTLTPGTGIEITSGNVINCTIDTTLYVVVTTLPAEPAPGNENKIHLLPDPSGTTGNEYIEYLWKGDEWEELGTAYAETDLSDYWTSGETQSAITSATSGLATTQYVDSAITAATSGLASTGYVDSAITSATSGLATTQYVDSAVTSATSGLASTQYVDSAITAATSGLASTGYVDSAVTAATSGLASTQYVDSAITSATSGLATTGYVDSAVTAATSGLASTGYVDSAITAATSGLASTGYVDSAVTAATSGLASETYVQNAISGLASESYVESAITAATSGLASTGYVDSAITSATSGLQETLVSGINIKTINSESLLGSGNIVISGGSGGGETVIELTQAEYDALTEYAEDTTYIITDATPINMDDYATTGTVNTLSGQVATLSGDIADKADKANVTARGSGDYYMPGWNNQGVITGSTQLYRKNIYYNGSSPNYVLCTQNNSLPDYYGPTSAGAKNAVLLSNGSGAPVWASYKFQFITQTAYDALSTKDSTCIYFIVGD